MTSLARSLSTLDGRSLLGLQKAAEREATRRASARSLIDFTCYTYPRYEPAGLHRQIAEQLERVERGEVDRLMTLSSDIAALQQSGLCLPRSWDRSTARRGIGSAAFPAPPS